MLQPSELAYQLSDSIRYCTVDGRVVVLDLHLGEYIIFDNAASEIWSILFGASHNDQCGCNLADPSVPLQFQSRHDIKDFLASCERRGFIHKEAGDTAEINPISPVRFCGPTIFNAWKCLLATRRTLARFGFSYVYELHRRMLRSETPRRREAVTLSTALRVFCWAENLFPTRDARLDCLPRSLALRRFLLSVGIDGVHYVGVRRFPC